MKEAFDLIKERLEEEELTSADAKAEAIIGMQGASANYYGGELRAFGRAIQIVSEVEEEYGNGKTNADRIRAMSDEELAEWLHNITQFDGDDGELMISIYNLDSEKDEDIRDSYGDLLEWLKSPTTD